MLKLKLKIIIFMKRQQPITSFFSSCKTPKLKTTTMQQPITKTFEFFEYLHLIIQNYNFLLMKLWLIGNKEMQYWMQECLKSLNPHKFEKRLNTLQIFKNIEYLKVYDNELTMNIMKYIPKFVKVLDICYFEIKDFDINLLPQTLTYLKASAKKLKNPNLTNLTSLILSNCQNFILIL